MYDTTKADWKLFRERLPEWQENYMEKLNNLYKEYIPKLAKKCPVVEIDASKDAQQVLSEAMRVINKRRAEMDNTEPCYHGGW